METKRIVISKSRKKKNGTLTEQVVYHSKGKGNKTLSTTRHEAATPGKQQGK